MYSSLLTDTVVTFLFVLTWVCAAYLGETCETHPTNLTVVTNPISANILQENNHTFFCKGEGAFLNWEVNSTFVKNIPEDWKLKVVDFHTSFHEGCVVESSMTILAETFSMTTTFAITCAMTNNGFEYETSEPAYLSVYVIGGARDVEFALPVNSSNRTMMQWKAPYTSLNSSLLHYNVTVIDDIKQVEVVTEETTIHTSYTIINDSLVPCDHYLLKILPFQRLSSSHVEVGMETETIQNFTGAILPATNIKSSLSVDLNIDSAQTTVYFQATFTECHLQWPERFTVESAKEGSSENSMFQSTEVIVKRGTNMYLLEKLELQQKYEVFVKMMNEYSSSISNSLTISTFLVQDLSIEVDKDRNQLNVRCVMAAGAEGKQCTLEMRNEAGDVQDNCNEESDGASAACTLIGLLPGEYMVWAYDEGYTESPAFKDVFIVTKELTEVPTSTLPTSRTNDDVVLESSDSTGQVDQGTDVAIIAGVAITVLISIVVLVVPVIVICRIRHHRKRSVVSESNRELNSGAPDAVHLYPGTVNNNYGLLPVSSQTSSSDEHNLSLRQNQPDDSSDPYWVNPQPVSSEPSWPHPQPNSSVSPYPHAQPNSSVSPYLHAESESSIGREPYPHAQPNSSVSPYLHAEPESSIGPEQAYAQVQAKPAHIPTTSNETTSGYMQHPKEWLVRPCTENPSLPHTPDLVRTPESIYL